MKVTPEHKRELMELNKWVEFVQYKETLISNGGKPADSHRKAISYFLGEAALESIAPKRSGRKPGSTVKKAKIKKPTPEEVEAVFGFSATPVEKPAVKRESRKGKTQVAKMPVSPLIEMAALEEFEGREAGEVEIVRWIARNMDIKGIKPSDCPDPAAWTILNQCRSNAMFRNTFLTTVWVRIIPSKSQLDDNSDAGKMDGEPQLKTLEKIQQMRDKAISETGRVS